MQSELQRQDLGPTVGLDAPSTVGLDAPPSLPTVGLDGPATVGLDAPPSLPTVGLDAQVLALNRFAALAEDDDYSEVDDGPVADGTLVAAVAKRVQAENLRSDLQAIDQALGELGVSGSQAVLGMRAWAVAQLTILEAEGF